MFSCPYSLDLMATKKVAVDPDIEAIQQKLLVRSLNLKKIAKLYLSFTQKVLDDKSTLEDCEAHYENFGCFLTQHFFATRKLLFQSNTASKQLSEYQDQLDLFGKEIDQVSNDITGLEVKLQEEAANKQHREECECISKVISALPSRSDTQKEINQLHEDLAKVEEEGSAITAEVDLREKQFQLLLFAVNELSQILNIDSEEGEIDNNNNVTFPSENKKRTSSELSSNPAKKQKL